MKEKIFRHIAWAVKSGKILEMERAYLLFAFGLAMVGMALVSISLFIPSLSPLVSLRFAFIGLNLIAVGLIGGIFSLLRK